MDRASWIDLAKDLGLALGITLVVVVGWQWMRPGPIAEGEAPALEGFSLDGEPWSLASVGEEIVVVNFWATWCGPCRREIPELTAFSRAHPEIAMVGVSVDTAMSTPQLKAASRKLGVGYDVVHDRDHSAATRWGVSSYPTTFVLDEARHVAAVRRGTVDRRALEALVTQARAHAH